MDDIHSFHSFPNLITRYVPGRETILLYGTQFMDGDTHFQTFEKKTGYLANKPTHPAYSTRNASVAIGPQGGNQIEYSGLRLFFYSSLAFDFLNDLIKSCLV